MSSVVSPLNLAGVPISDAANLTSLNLTGQFRCSLPCSFDNPSFEEYNNLDHLPCFYTVEVVETFKTPNNNMVHSLFNIVLLRNKFVISYR